MDELISKRAAIDEVTAWLEDRMDDKKNGKPLTDRIKDLPPSQIPMIVYHQNNVSDLRSKFVGIVVKHFKSADAFLDYIDGEKYTSDFDCFCSFDGECYIICRNTGEYVNWYKFTHIGRDIHTNMTVEMLDFFIERFSKAEC